MASGEICKYFKAGHCLRYDTCRYEHVRQTDKTIICNDFLMNNCQNEDCIYAHHPKDNWNQQITCFYYEKGNCERGRCKYYHSPSKINKKAKMSSCYYFQSGNCRYNDECWFSHEIYETPAFEDRVHQNTQSQGAINNQPHNMGIPSSPEYAFGNSADITCPQNGIYQTIDCFDECSFCSTLHLHPTDENIRSNQMEKCETLFKQSENKECSICREKIMEHVPRLYFGILNNCDHVFCYDCIKSWRKEGLHGRICPLCRTMSELHIPSQFFVKGKDKEELVFQYKSERRDTDCINFRNGYCQFGRRCFFRH